jgi:N-acetylmuramoyl-L-alanine amidase
MTREIKKIAVRSALFFGILAVSIAGMQLAVLRNEENAPDVRTVSAEQMPVIVLDAGHGGSA